MDYFLDALREAFALITRLDPEVYRIVWTSVSISICAVVLASLLALPLGLLIAMRRFAGKRLVLQSLNTLMALPTVVVGLFLYGLLSRQGPLGGLGLLYTPWAVIIGECVLILPIILNLIITAVNSADPRLALTCKALGASGSQVAWTYLSELRYGLVAAIIVGLGRAIGEVGVAMMLGGNIQGHTRTMTTAIALETSKGEFELALALGLLLLAVAFTLNFALQSFQRLDP